MICDSLSILFNKNRQNESQAQSFAFTSEKASLSSSNFKGTRCTCNNNQTNSYTSLKIEDDVKQQNLQVIIHSSAEASPLLTTTSNAYKINNCHSGNGATQLLEEDDSDVTETNV